MSLKAESMGQLSLLEQGTWRATVQFGADHRLVVLCKSIPWSELEEKAVPILYDDHGIDPNIGRQMDLRAHLGAYILQTVHGWTDRWTEEMIRYYVPARIFCGYLDSTGSIDHTRIEDFRNRFGQKGAQLITRDMLKVAKEFGFTEPTDLDMDTTAQEAGITHPTEMKLIAHLMKKVKSIHGFLKNQGKRGVHGIKVIAKVFSKIQTEYRFYAKTKEKKDRIVRGSVALSKKVLKEISKLVPGKAEFESLLPRYQKDILRLNQLGPELMDQILYWLNTGKVAQNKIVSLWKQIPKAVKKGKIGKPVEFGRKWIVNCYRGGYVLLSAPENPKVSDQHCVLKSLEMHMEVFQESPETFAADRGMWSEENLGICLGGGVQKIGIQPAGQSEPFVSQRDLRALSNRRAGIEPRIAHLKTRGLGRSRMKSDEGDLISGYRSALSYNLSHLMRDLAGNQVVTQCG